MDTSPESSDSFPLKSFISEKSGGGGSSAQPVADSEAGAGEEEAINPEKLAYILIGVRPWEHYTGTLSANNLSDLKFDIEPSPLFALSNNLIRYVRNVGTKEFI